MFYLWVKLICFLKENTFSLRGHNCRLNTGNISPGLLLLPTAFELRIMLLCLMKQSSLLIKRTQDASPPGPWQSSVSTHAGLSSAHTHVPLGPQLREFWFSICFPLQNSIFTKLKWWLTFLSSWWEFFPRKIEIDSLTQIINQQATQR